MRYLIPILLSLPFLFLCTTNERGTVHSEPVNAVLGDASFMALYGEAPGASASEDLRIRTHLQYVEELLRKATVTHLSSDQQRNRARILDHLHNYRLSGNFPRNYDHPGDRRPCFIDRDGNICAVGYLVEQTAGRELAEEINRHFQYAYISEMELPELANWVEASGLSLQECAMIQPQYQGWWPVPDNNHIEPGYAIGSAALSGANLSIMAINGIQLLNGRQTIAIPAIGLVTGTGQLVYGLGMYPRPGNNVVDNPVNRNVSMVNIGVGTSTLVLSAVNLATRKEDRRNAWNVFSMPVAEQGNVVGLSFSRRL
jgi:hypothetical protein